LDEEQRRFRDCLGLFGRDGALLFEEVMIDDATDARASDVAMVNVKCKMRMDGLG
jgi:hypothetical protein